MKLKKILIGMTAAVMSAACLGISASAEKANLLLDVVNPIEDPQTDEEKAMNDKYYSIGCMGFFMNQSWKWNQGDWIGITEDAKIDFSYKISKVLADPQVNGTGTLGSMGIMFANVPEEGFPYVIEISDAKFTAEDGTVTNLDSWNGVKYEYEHPEGGIRIVIRGDDEVDEETGEIKTKATPEVAGWNEEGKFEGGTLSMTIDLNPTGASLDIPAEEPEEPEAKPEEKPEEKPAEDGNDSANDTGLAEASLAMLAISGAAVIISSKKSSKR